MYAKTFLTTLLFSSVIAGIGCEHVQADTTNNNVNHGVICQQLQATSTNLEQQILNLTSHQNSTSKKAKLVSLEVQKANIDSQLLASNAQTDNTKIQQKIAIKNVVKTNANKIAVKPITKEHSSASSSSASSSSASSSSASSSSASSSSASSSSVSSSSASSSSASEQNSSASQTNEVLSNAASLPSNALSIITVNNTSTSTNNVTTGNNQDTRTKLVNYAKQFIGVPYVWGGTSPQGFDCSGLTSYVYAHVLNQNIGRTTYNQADSGKHIALKDLRPGDLIMENGGEHIAMYIGDGKQIAAPQPGENVKIQPIWDAMYGLSYVQ